MKTVLLTGGTGFVGAQLTRRLLAQGHRLNLLVRPGYQSWRIADIQDHVQIHTVDLRDGEQLRKVVAPMRPEWIFHLAANGAYSWEGNLWEIMHTNVNAMVNLVEACSRTGFEAFVNTGSSSEYGFKDFAPSENEWIDPNSYYAVTKAFGTQYGRFVGISRNLKITTLRLYSVYGPFEEPKRFIPTLLVKGLAGKLPDLVDPETARDFVFIDDVIEAYLRVVGSDRVEPGAVFNVGSGIPMTIGETVEMARQIMEIRADPQWHTFPHRTWDTTTWVANIAKIKSALGWKPEVDLRSGLKKTLAWFKTNPDYLDYYRKAGKDPL
jgi:dolichol-phosphate mannosyltransferase